MEQESMKKSKQKARDKVQPRMGKIDIDYQVLHDAFFKYQVKPKMIGHGDLYYEGREFEVRAIYVDFIIIIIDSIKFDWKVFNVIVKGVWIRKINKRV
jgi:hypothetical protein